MGLTAPFLCYNRFVSKSNYWVVDFSAIVQHSAHSPAGPAAGEIPPVKSLLRDTVGVAWPSIVESFLVALVGFIDTIMVSVLGSYAIAAVGLTQQPKFLGIAVFMAMSTAISALVARRRGEQNRESAVRILRMCILVTLVLTAVVSAVCVAFADPIIRFAGSAQDTHEAAVEYFQILMGGIVFTTVMLVINAAQAARAIRKLPCARTLSPTSSTSFSTTC